MTAQSLVFQSIQFNAIDRDGQPWLTSMELAKALGYANEDSVSRIYRRNANEFTEHMSQTVNLTVSGKINNLQHKMVRIFSLRGAHLLAMFARTKVAKEFRKWVLDILDKEVGAGAPTAKGALTPEEYAELLEKRGKIIVDRDDTAARLISLEQQDILFNLMAIRFPEGKDRPYGWSRFNRHFVISSYKHLQADRFAAACCYIPAMPDRQVKALPAPDLNALIPRLTWTQPDPIGGKDSIRVTGNVKLTH